MKNFLLKQLNRVDFKTALELFMLLSLLVVWIVWPLRGTIAARNIALVLGAISSIAWLCVERPKFAIMDLLPIGLLLCVPSWLLGLYFYVPVAPSLQWDDLRGTWLRVVVAIIFAIGLGKLYLYRPQLRQFFFQILFIWPVVTLFIFVSQGLFTHSWLGEHIYIYVFKSKVAGVYFLIWSILSCFVVVHCNFIVKCHMRSTLTKPEFGINNAVGFLFLICMIDYFSLQSLNAFISLAFCFIFLAYLTIRQMRSHIYGARYFIKVGLILAGAFVLAASLLAYDEKYMEGKLANIISDIDFIVHEDTTGAWKWNGPYKGVDPIVGDSYNGIYPPINTISGKQVNGSTYERVTWGLEGLNFLKLYPLGLGYTGQAFSHYMREAYPGSLVTKTHSGWLDFALGAGIFGLIAVLAAMVMIFLRAKICMKDNIDSCQMPLYICWALGILMLLWLIAELSDREFIEHFFFMMAFFCITAGMKKNL
jgi:hypothetical protein